MVESAYVVNIPLTPGQDSHPRVLTWHDSLVERKLDAFSYSNPLGVGEVVGWLVSLYYPVLVIVATLSNLFTLWVLRSHFLSHLVIQPTLSTYLHLHNLLLMVGPFYVWLVQCAGLGIHRSRVYPCFLLVWIHNFALLSTSGILIAMVIERAVSIGKPEILWKLWKRAYRAITYMLLLAASVLAIAGLLLVEGALDYHSRHYPVCMPWWDNDSPVVSPVWFKIMTINFSLAPALLVMLSLLFLLVSVARFSLLVRRGVETLNHYNALYMEIKATQHLKFVKSVVWLGLLFLVTCTPLGLFIVFGPAFLTLDESRDDIVSAYSGNTTTTPNILGKTVNVTTEPKMFQPPKGGETDLTYPHRPLLEYSYILVSRSNTETLFWSIYYSFSLLIVPVLLATEVLFKREWRGCATKLFNLLCCRKEQLPLWPTFDLFDTEDQSGYLAGPYIARNDEYSSASGLQKACKEAKCIKVYDATKAQLAGRKAEEEMLYPRRQVAQRAKKVKAVNGMDEGSSDVNEEKKPEYGKVDKSAAETAALAKSLRFTKVPMAMAAAVDASSARQAVGSGRKPPKSVNS